ncbi:alpha-ribazole phosphatase [Sphingomonas sp. BE270]|nr:MULTISPECIES: histidine phosphatase family protein [unclassified Sphingomonas]MDR6848436.1 alpha-ribazole phosphatase [Sphingomonas sp. BE137]MDR7259098.1 alpha-ribazole phosphatase [Sphingomonas sp. BE270]
MSSFVLHLLRHGEPEGAGRLLGHTDTAPLASGIAACVAQARELDLEVLIASDLTRAKHAGEAIAAMTDIPLTIDPRWRELDFGQWDGLPPNAVDGAALSRFWDDPDGCAPPAGERWSDLVGRVARALADLAAAPTLVVTHAGAMRAALAVLCGFDSRQSWAIDLPYASLLSLRVWPGETRAAQIIGLRP